MGVKITNNSGDDITDVTLYFVGLMSDNSRTKIFDQLVFAGRALYLQ